jgi:hypothetical protein
LQHIGSADAISRFGFQFQAMAEGWIVKSGNGATLARSSSGTLIFTLQAPPARIERHPYTQSAAAIARRHNECACTHEDTEQVKHGRAIKWSIAHHQALVTSAIDLLADRKFENIEGRQRVLNMVAHPEFKRTLLLALADADNAIIYNDLFTWVSHFYDPDTQTNYMGFTAPTALNSYVKYAKRSRNTCDELDAARKNGYSTEVLDKYCANAGYQLGLAMHFLTDMGQPMHAANFPNVIGEGNQIPTLTDTRHAGFEALGETLFPAHRVRADAVTAAEIDPTNLNIDTERELGHQLARKSKNLYSEQLRPILRAHVTRIGHRRPHLEYNNAFTEAECGAILREATRNAQLATASALLLWGRRDTDPYLWPAGTLIASGQASAVAPTMAHYCGQAHVFWLSNEEKRRILCSGTTEGLDWSAPQAVPMGDADATDSKVLAIKYAMVLFLFWKPTQGAGLCMATVEGYGQVTEAGLQWKRHDRILTNIVMDGMPSACVHDGRLYLSWVPKSGAGQLMLSSMFIHERTWTTPYPLNPVDSSPLAPALCSSNQYLYAFWRANDESCRIFWSRSTDGLAWSNGQTINGSDSTPAAPTALYINKRVTVFWTANDAGRALWSSSSNDGVTWPGGTRINTIDTGSESPVGEVNGMHYYLAWRDGDGGGRLSFSSKIIAP